MPYEYSDDQLNFHKENVYCKAVNDLIKKNREEMAPLLKAKREAEEALIPFQRKHKAIVDTFKYHERASARTKYVHRCNRDVGPEPKDVADMVAKDFKTEKLQKGF